MLIAIRHDEVTGLVPSKVYDFPAGSLKVAGVNVGGGGGGGGTPAGGDRDVQLADTGAFGVTAGAFKCDLGANAGVAHGSALGAATYLTPPLDYGVPTGAGAQIHGRLNPTVVTNQYSYFQAGSSGAVAQGQIDNAETIGTGTQRIQAGGAGAIAGGFATVADTSGSSFNQYIDATSPGAIALGQVSDRYGKMIASADGALVQGRVRGNNSYIRAYGIGSRAFGLCGDVGGLESASIYATGHGSIAGGYSFGNTDGVRALGAGSLAQGRTTVPASSYKIEASGNGAQARGYTQGGSIYAGGHGALASGHTFGGTMYANGAGALATGYTNGNTISANYAGAVAMGNSTNGGIYANANGAGQFGPGTNGQYDSFAVGQYLRFNSVAPGITRNGDFWVSGGYIYCYSNYTTRKFDGTDI